MCKPQSQFAALSIAFSTGDTIIKLQLLVQFFLGSMCTNESEYSYNTSNSGDKVW